MLTFFIGLIVGAMVGVTVMCLIVINREEPKLEPPHVCMSCRWFDGYCGYWDRFVGDIQSCSEWALKENEDS